MDGPFGSNLKTSDYTDKGVPVLQGSNISNDRFVWRDIRFISYRKARSLMRSNVKVGDILTVKIGSVGYSAIIYDLHGYPYAIIPANLLRIRVTNRESSSTFLAHYLTSPIGKNALVNSASTTAQPALSLNKIRALQIPLPSLPEQRAIAAVLSDMDTEIQALERRREKVKQIKQGMMQQLLTGRVRLVKLRMRQ